ncbi:hypothetical protein Tco_1127488 [Tanacetum coccineum]
MAIRAYEEDQRKEKLNQKIEEKIEKLKNLIQYFIRNPISSVKTLQPLTTKVPAITTMIPAKPIQNSPPSDDLTSDQNKKTTEKGVGKEGFSCGLNKSKGSHLGLRHCVAIERERKGKGLSCG